MIRGLLSKEDKRGESVALLKVNDKIGIIALSNGLSEGQKQTMKKLEVTLTQLGFNVVLPKSLYRTVSVFHATDKERAAMLMDYYKDHQIKAIFDVSGGDLANGVLPYLDYQCIKNNPKPFFGYSDLTTVVNAIYHQTNQLTFLYQIRHLVGQHEKQVVDEFEKTFLLGHSNLFNFEYEWVQGESMKGITIGGNIRCFLKLAGTPYMPSFKHNILFLESFSGDLAKIATYLNHYKQLGVFDEINGLILGYFTELEEAGYSQTLVELVKTIVDNPKLPIVKTAQIGHQSNSKCLIIGKSLSLGR